MWISMGWIIWSMRRLRCTDETLGYGCKGFTRGEDAEKRVL